MGIVYLLTAPSGKRYVGQAHDIKERIGHYRRGKCKNQRALHAAITKYGWESFSVSVIAHGIQTQSALDATERAFIALLGTLSPGGYNLKQGGCGGGKHCAETKAMLAAISTGRKQSPEARAKLSAALRGKPRSPEHRAAHAAAMRSPEVRAKISAAGRGKKRGAFSAEHRAKLSAASRNPSPETRAKMSAAQRGKKHSPETRAKISAATKGRKKSTQTRAKMSAAAYARWEREKSFSVGD